jgi:hypothetical protein
MAHFTQLNLQGNSGNKPAPIPASPKGTPGKAPANPPKKRHGTAKIVAIACSLIGAALVTTLTLGTNGCSKNNKEAITAPSAAMAAIHEPPPLTAPMPASLAAVAAPQPAKKSPRQRTISIYKNADFGISFRYPKTYSLKKGDTSEWAGLGPVEMNFIQPGGVPLAVVQLPKGMYPGTDLSYAFFSLSVNPKMSSEECAQFSFEDAKPAAVSSSDTMDGAPAIQPAKMKIGAAEFTEVESTGGEDSRHADAKYYHVSQNGACYEFMLGIQTADSIGKIKPVDQAAVFNKLNWMLSTVKITPAGVPAKTTLSIANTLDAPPAQLSSAETMSSSTAAAATTPTATDAAAGRDKN